jgi:hypothetical protein
VSRPHAPELPQRLTHAQIVQAAAYLAAEVGAARRDGRRSIPLALPLAERLSDLCCEIASRSPETWV